MTNRSIAQWGRLDYIFVMLGFGRKRDRHAWVIAAMRNIFFSLFFGLLGSASTAFAEDSFEGRIDYEIDSGGQVWRYAVWLKGDLWRSELRSGQQVFELRIGNSETGEAFLVNEAGESFRSIGAGSFGPGPAGSPPGDARGKKKKGGKPVDLEKVVVVNKRYLDLLGRSAQLEELKGPGKRLQLWWVDDLGAISGMAIPRLKALEEKKGLMPLYFEEREAVPLLIALPNAKGKKAFSMKAVGIEAMEIEDAFVTLPDGYKPEMGGRPMGGGGGGGRPRGGRPTGPPPGM